jgi:hypothetical protein
MTERGKELEEYTIYHLYAERHMGEYGTTDFGYFSSKKRALEVRQKEWERIKKDSLNTEHCKMDGYYESDWHIDEIKVEGYTKKHFPVEKLIKWLEEDTQTHELKSIIKAKGVDCFSGLGLNVGLGVISIVIRLAFDTVAKKIKELGEEG